MQQCQGCSNSCCDSNVPKMCCLAHMVFSRGWSYLGCWGNSCPQINALETHYFQCHLRRNHWRSYCEHWIQSSTAAGHSEGSTQPLMVYWPPLSFLLSLHLCAQTPLASCDKSVVFGSEGKVLQNSWVPEKGCEKWKHIPNLFVAGACSAK